VEYQVEAHPMPPPSPPNGISPSQSPSDLLVGLAFGGTKNNLRAQCYALCSLVRIPAMSITHSDLMAITIPSDADHRRSEATLGCSYHAEVIGIRQSFCC